MQTTLADRPRELLTIREAARQLDIQSRTLRGWIAAGRLPVVRLSSRCVRIELADLVAFIASRKA